MIKKHPVLKSRHKNALRPIADVFILGSDAQDQKGDPLLDDPIKDIFLSPKYSRTAVDALKGYGLRVNYVSHIIDFLKSDLESDNSKMRGGDMTEHWHSCVARFLSQHLEKTPTIRSLRILPLRDGTWTSCQEGPVYLPSTGGIRIPAILDLRVLNSSALKNPDRRALFEQLGVSEATTTQVRGSIFEHFVSCEILEVDNDLEFLSYLYLTHQTGVHTCEHYRDVWVVTNDRLLCPQDLLIYLPGTNDPYSPESILTRQGTAPEFSFAFLFDEIYEQGPAKPNFGHPSWKSWLVDYLGIHERLSLLSPDGDSLSEPVIWVFNHHPKMFVGLLGHLWPFEGSKVIMRRALVLGIQELSAKHLCEVRFSPKLKSTWLPYPHLQELVQRYMEYPDQFPFLKIESDDMDLGPGMKWSFLSKHFSVGKDDDIVFLLEILRSIERSCTDEPSISQIQRVLQLYVAIYAKLAVARDQAGVRSRIW